LVMDPIVLPSPPGPVTVSGTVPVTDPAQSVSVNGVAAPVTVQGGVGRWTAVVPLPSDEAMIFAATATTSEVATAQASTDAVLPPRAYLGSYNFSQNWRTDDPAKSWKEVTYSLNWDGDPDNVDISSGSSVEEDRDRSDYVTRTLTRWYKGQLLGDRWVYGNGALQNTDLNSVVRPNVGPNCLYDIASEQCDAGKVEDVNGHSYFWRRSVKSTLKVFTGSRTQDRQAWFLTLYGEGTTYDPYYQGVTLSFWGPRWHPTPCWNPAPWQITVGGKELYCDGCIFDMYPKNRHVDVTPKVKDNDWYRISVTPAWPPLYAMKRIYHPLSGMRDSFLQPVFDEAARLLGVDDDPGDPSCIIGGDTDDVPYYADFYILNDKAPLEMTGPLAAPGFNVVVDPAYEQGLLNIPAITQISVLLDDNTLGEGMKPSLRMPAIILAGSGNRNPCVVAHEWGHTRNLDHFLAPESRKTRAIMWERPRGYEERNQINLTEVLMLQSNQAERPPEP